MKGYFIIDPKREKWLRLHAAGRAFVSDVQLATRFQSYWDAEKACKLMGQLPVYGNNSSPFGRLLIALKVAKIKRADRLFREEVGRLTR